MLMNALNVITSLRLFKNAAPYRHPSYNQVICCKFRGPMRRAFRPISISSDLHVYHTYISCYFGCHHIRLTVCLTLSAEDHLQTYTVIHSTTDHVHYPRRSLELVSSEIHSTSGPCFNWPCVHSYQRCFCRLPSMRQHSLQFPPTWRFRLTMV